jgi:serine-type D-Ala-D-Ala carboxypeptidase/endopeptidase (penicillin-binding protein 4)
MAQIRRLIPPAIAVLLIVAAVAPITVVRRLQNEAGAAEAAAADLRLPILAEPGRPVVNSPTPMLRVERAPEPLFWPVLDRRLGAELDSMVASWPGPYCLTVAVDGRPVYSTGTAAMIPASVEKLVTAAAVLTHLDPAERLETLAVTTAPISEGVLDGDLYIVGGGDPMLTTIEYSAAYSRQPQLRTSIEDFADLVAATGITHIRGNLIADETRHDAVRYVATWPDRYRAQHNSGPLGALTVNDGFTAWSPSRVDAVDPAAYFVAVFRNQLADRGVSLGGRVDVGVAPTDATTIASILSPTVEEMVAQMLRESDNNTAETMLKEVGLRVNGEASTAAGAAVATATVAELVPGLSPPTVLDGSGLDRGNLVSCPTLVGLLDHFGPDSALSQGLAVAGETGTLGHRFAESDLSSVLRAKTGLLDNVNGLAGFIDRPDGGHITFAQLLNGVPLTGRLGFDIQDELVFALARHLEPLDPAQFVPEGADAR